MKLKNVSKGLFNFIKMYWIPDSEASVFVKGFHVLFIGFVIAEPA